MSEGRERKLRLGVAGLGRAFTVLGHLLVAYLLIAAPLMFLGICSGILTGMRR